MTKKQIISMILYLITVGFFSSGLPEKIPAGVFSGENKAERLYGKGVHAFFDGDYNEAIRLLEQVGQLESEDPRPYYFLAIAYHRLDMDDKAEPIFRKAAKLEWNGRNFRDFKVSDSLRRIQGKERSFIEMFRNQAKVDWKKTERRRQNELYGKKAAEEKEVLKAIAGSFVGAAPFGARSVHPFRSSEEKKEDDVIPTDDRLPFADSVKPRPVSKPLDSESGEKKESVDEPIDEAVEEAPGTASSGAMKAEAQSEDDPFGTPDEKKEGDTKQEEPKKKEVQSEDEDDPFA